MLLSRYRFKFFYVFFQKCSKIVVTLMYELAQKSSGNRISEVLNFKISRQRLLPPPPPTNARSYVCISQLRSWIHPWLKIAVGAITSAASLRRLSGILSCPVDLDVLIVESNLYILVNWTFCIVNCVAGLVMYDSVVTHCYMTNHTTLIMQTLCFKNTNLRKCISS
jgi:hypothetical protein